MTTSFKRQAETRRLRHLLVGLTTALLVVGGTHLGQTQPGEASKSAEVVILSSSQSEPYLEVIDGFWQSLRSQRPKLRGYTYFSSTDPKKNEDFMKEIAGKDPDVLFALGSKATREIRALFPARPLVVTMVLDEEIFAEAKQITGVSLSFPARVHLKWLRRFLPEARRVFILFDPGQNDAVVKELTLEAEALGLQIHALAVESGAQLPAALKSVERQADVLLGLADSTVYSGKTAKAVLLSTYRNRIPFAGLSRSWVKAGALYALERDYTDLGRQSAGMVAQILIGTKVTDIAPQSPDTVLPVVNTRTAKHLRLQLSPELVEQAAEVFH